MQLIETYVEVFQAFGAVCSALETRAQHYLRRQQMLEFHLWRRMFTVVFESSMLFRANIDLFYLSRIESHSDYVFELSRRRGYLGFVCGKVEFVQEALIMYSDQVTNPVALLDLHSVYAKSVDLTSALQKMHNRLVLVGDISGARGGDEVGLELAAAFLGVDEAYIRAQNEAVRGMPGGSVIARDVNAPFEPVLPARPRDSPASPPLRGLSSDMA
jgi:hypothetical protein